MRKVLLAWELGGNRGHVVKLGGIAGQLRERGFEPVFAVQRPDALRAIRGIAETSTVHQAPVWPGLLNNSGFRSYAAPITFGDILADLGLRDSGVIEYLIRAWDALLTDIRPAAIVSEFAPALQIAAHARVPVVAVGTGFTVPPSSLASFPVLDERASKPNYDEAALLQVVNRASERTGRRRYDKLPAIAAADRVMPAVFHELDPYAEMRTQPQIAPFLSGQPAPPATRGEEIFVYLHDSAPSPACEAVTILAGRGRKIRAFLPNADGALLETLARAGVMLAKTSVPIGDIALRSRLAVTNGGIGLASSALACGLPLVVLPTDLEKTLNGRALERLGTCRLVSLKDDGRPKDADEIAGAMAAAADDTSLPRRATAIARDFAARLSEDPARIVCNAVATLVSPQ